MKLSQLGTTEDYEMGVVHNAIENLLDEHDGTRINGLSMASVRRRAGRGAGRGQQTDRRHSDDRFDQHMRRARAVAAFLLWLWDRFSHHL